MSADSGWELFFSAFGRASPKTDSEAAQESLPNAPLVYRSSTMAVSDLLYCSISIALAQLHIYSLPFISIIPVNSADDNTTATR
jgi:hypothetical protein